MASMQRNYSHTGFTVLELLVVIAILAVIAGTVLTAFNSDFTSEQEETAALYEMTQIRDAILQFKQDNPSFPLDGTRFCSAADASFLINDQYDATPAGPTCNLDTDHDAWDPNYRLGWQGPYMSKVANTLRTISVTIEFDGDTAGTGTDFTNVTVLTDPYGDTGNPYYFFDLDDDDASAASGVAEARIVSAGPDGIYDGPDCTITDTNVDPNPCDTDLLCSAAPNSDDLVLCLR